METRTNVISNEKYSDLIDVYIDNILRLEGDKVVSKDFAGFLLGFLLRKSLAKEVEGYLQSILREKRRK